MNIVTVSTVTPVYAGAATLTSLVEALAKERQAWEDAGLPLRLVEAIFVDDGSKDGSADVLRELGAKYDWVRPVTLGRNYGQHPATIAGTLHTSGDWVVTLDEDLQHPPRHILSLLVQALVESADIIYARPAGVVHQRIWYRDLSSRIAKRVVAHLAGNPNVRLFNSFRLMRGQVARAAAAVSVHDTYLDMLIAWFSDRVGAVDLPLADQRADMEPSSYNLRKLLSHVRRLVMSARTDYSRIGAAIGAIGVTVGVALSAYSLIAYWLSPVNLQAPGWMSLFVTIIFFGGLSALLIGILFEYFSTVLKHAQGKPSFFVVDRSTDDSLVDAMDALKTLATARSNAC